MSYLLVSSSCRENDALRVRKDELRVYIIQITHVHFRHIYCWPCVLHYLALSDKTWRKCPICYEAIHVGDLKR